MPSAMRRWFPVALWVLVIYTTIPFVRAMRDWFVERWDPPLISWLVATALVVIAVAAVSGLRRRAHELRRGALTWISAVAAVMVLWTFSLRSSPEEAVHFLEYGVLAVLLHRALRPTIPDALVFVAGALLGSLVGTVDEVIQWISPSRYWDWRDLVLNAGAGALVQLALWRTVPTAVSGVTAGSLRIVFRLTVAQLLLVTVCLANTPSRVAVYAPHLPSCDHLMSSNNPMAEYGHLHRVPGLGSFKSRLDLTELETEDHNRATEVAVLVDGARHRYGRFLDTWSVSADPFTYEMRVHLFARDRNFGKAKEQSFEGSVALTQLTTSWHENLLLEEVFGTTLGHSSYLWKPGLRKKVAALYLPDSAFLSDAGSHLITFASEGVIRAILLGVISLLLAAEVVMGCYRGRRP